MTTLWKLRLYLARLLLGAGPEGYDLCFRRGKLLVRRKPLTEKDIVDGWRLLNGISDPEYIADGVPIIT